jgi:hypothetical protein
VIVGSLLLIVVAVGLLALGLLRGSNPYLVGSIAASLLAAIALVAGSGQQVRARMADADEEADEEATGRGLAAAQAGAARAARRRAHADTSSTQVMAAVREPSMWDASDDDLPVGERRGQPAEPAIPVQSAAADMDGGRAGSQHAALDDDDDYDDEDPADEPVAQQVSAAEAARVARMNTDVLVVDGRPRYHLAGCVHLVGRESEPLPVSEAVELGFTPCGLCEPDSALLAEARRV